MRGDETRLAGLFLSRPDSWHLTAQLRVAARIRTRRLYAVLHQWQLRGWLETSLVTDGSSRRRGYRLADLEGFQLYLKNTR